MPFNLLEIEIISETPQADTCTITFDPNGSISSFPQVHSSYSPPGPIPATLVDQTVYWMGQDDSVYRLAPPTPHPGPDLANWSFGGADSYRGFTKVGNSPGKVDRDSLYFRVFDASEESHRFAPFGGKLMAGITAVVNQTVVGKGGKTESHLYGVRQDSLFQFVLAGRPSPLRSFVGLLPASIGESGSIVQLDSNHLGFMDDSSNVYSVSVSEPLSGGTPARLSSKLLVSASAFAEINWIAGGNGFLYFMAEVANPSGKQQLFSVDSESPQLSHHPYPGLEFPANSVKSLLTDASNNLLLFTDKAIYRIPTSHGVPLEFDIQTQPGGNYSHTRRLPGANLTIPTKTTVASYPRLHLKADSSHFYLWATFDPLSPLHYSFWWSESPFGYPEATPPTKAHKIPVSNPEKLGIEEITGLRLKLRQVKKDGLTIGALIIDPDIVDF